MCRRSSCMRPLTWRYSHPKIGQMLVGVCLLSWTAACNIAEPWVGVMRRLERREDFLRVGLRDSDLGGASSPPKSQFREAISICVWDPSSDRLEYHGSESHCSESDRLIVSSTRRRNVSHSRCSQSFPLQLENLACKKI